MTDREMLELAAKAAGIKGRYADGVIWYRNPFGDEVGFNPAKDDGDALRLVVKLGIHLQFAMDYAVSYAGSVHAKQFTERDGADPYAATRRAIVRAAAEIGKGMVAQPSGKDLPEDDYYKSMAEAFYRGKP